MENEPEFLYKLNKAQQLLCLEIYSKMEVQSEEVKDILISYYLGKNGYLDRIDKKDWFDIFLNIPKKKRDSRIFLAKLIICNDLIPYQEES